MDIIGSIKKFIANSRHVMSISYKPSAAEFEKSAKLIIFGILLIGFVGFIIALIISLIITGSFSLI
jgi:protein translocase SEC61 complex gamma subunit